MQFILHQYIIRVMVRNQILLVSWKLFQLRRIRLQRKNSFSKFLYNGKTPLTKVWLSEQSTFIHIKVKKYKTQRRLWTYSETPPYSDGLGPMLLAFADCS